jgi:hypothetical protein
LLALIPDPLRWSIGGTMPTAAQGRRVFALGNEIYDLNVASAPRATTPVSTLALTLLSLKHELRVMEPQRSGSIANISSTMGSSRYASSSHFSCQPSTRPWRQTETMVPASANI